MTNVCSLEPFNYETVPQPDDETGLQLAQEQLQSWLKRFLDCVCSDLSTLVGEGITADYSTSEQASSRTWFVASEPIYQKSISFGAMPNATTKSVAHGISGLDKVVRHEFWLKRDSDGTQAPCPLVNDTAITSCIQLTVDGTNVSCRTGANYSAWNGRLTIWYTRT